MDPPNSGRKKRNKDKDVDPYERAAEALWNAEFLLIIAGPSFCEDSSKTAFADERCNPKLIGEPNKFFGFWGQFYNRYNDKQPHDGYSTLRKWRDQFFDAFGVDIRKRMKGIAKKVTKKGDDEEEQIGDRILQRCYIVTSNLDGFFMKAGFRDDEVYEMYGNINQWQCTMPCRPTVWTLDHFRFEIDPVLKEAKPIKYTEDARNDSNVDSWDIIDEDAEPLPNLTPDKKEEEMSDRERAHWKREVEKRMLARLHRTTIIPLPVEHQIHAERYAHNDHFTAAPATSYENPIEYTFPELQRLRAMEEQEGDEEESESQPTPRDGQSESGQGGAPSNKKQAQDVDDLPPEQPYILKKRVCHHLAHLNALVKNQFVYQEGVFTTCDPEEEKVSRKKMFQAQQKFFDEGDAKMTEKRKQHIRYNISLYTRDADKPSHLDEEPVYGEDFTTTLDSTQFSPGTHPPGSPTFSQLGLSASSPLGGTGFQGAKGLLSTSNFAQSTTLGPPASPQPTTTAEEDATSAMDASNVDGHGMSSPKSPSHMSADWSQGDGGKFFFSYVPVVETTKDPFDVYYDHVKIPFPTDEYREDIPKRGKISCVVECVIMPEPAEDATPKPDPKKGKKKKKTQPSVKPRPIDEPTRYCTYQMVGRLNTSRKDRKSAGSVMSAQSGQSRSTVDISSNSASKHTVEEEEGEAFEYRISSHKGHILKLGVNATASRTLKYIALELPIVTPGQQHIGVRREPADTKPLSTFMSSEFAFMDYRQRRGSAEAGKGSKKNSKKKPRPIPNHQLCQFCKDLARPHVLMNKQDIRCVPIPKKPYMQWERAMLEDLKLDGGKSVVILELGCEKKTDQCHKHAERIYKLTKNSQRSTLIRVSKNPIEAKKSGGISFGQGAETQITIGENVVLALGGIDRAIQDRTRRK
eukprot:TRINITY_DN62595_c0_g1_i1.p1 TRINITY_DN62595_c0_g1~~TRINITY_DN62595_c0_g1_i1.p1  ORF type:complete len:916 (+),score=110.56 TRINITY_DN62595_c0_g1_i1:35-2782(+)